MPVLARTLRQHLQIVRTYPAAMLVVAATFLLVLYYGHVGHRMAHAIGYISAVWLGAFVTDLTVNLRPHQAIGFPIKHPLSRELAAIFVCSALGLVFLAIRFSALWQQNTYRIFAIPLIVFVYPIVLALLYLLHFKYKPAELGVNLHYWYLPLLIHLIVGGITLSVARDRSHWHSGIRDLGGIPGLLFTGIVCAALSEEFTRMLLQTRLGSALHDKGLGFVLATFLWAGMHIPVGSQGSKAAFLHVLVTVWTIMPVGFLWGYLTHRTRSLLPAVLVHGLNLWGLQNL